MRLGVAPENLLPGRAAASFYSGAFLGKNMVYIYGLRCPIDGDFRYIGKTINIKSRIRVHISDARSGKYKHHTSNWIRSLLAQGLEPIIEVLEECTVATWQQAEQGWIAKGRRIGWRLTNSTAGGEGTPQLSERGRASKSEAMKKAWQTEAFRDRIVSARNDPQFIKEQSQRILDRWKDPEHRQKMQDARWTDEKRTEQSLRLVERKDKIQRAMTPEVRARQAASLKLNWAKRKAKNVD